ncbi:type VI secretion system protein TssA [Aquincola sp. MAHUQ-54]|uniref:Type VI secretion system protein TssA n=1 Tax=Aquincola agrisoli TaxID=3119538 RepID=A0AAW9QFG9_9BURK
MSDVFTGTSAIEGWLQPLSEENAPCGPDLEYDNDFLALNQSAAGKPETQFEAAVPPDWRVVRAEAEALMERTRDLRVAVLWVRACTHLEGFAAVPEGLRLLHGLLETFWETLHPLPDPDDGDPYARMNALGVLRESDGLVGDVRRALLFSQRGVGEVRVRSVEVALGLMPARDGEPAYTRDQLGQMLGAAVAQDPALSQLPAQAMAHLKTLSALANDRAGIESAPDLKPLQSLLHTLVGVMPAPAAAPDAGADGEAAADEAGTEAAPGAARAAPARGLSGTVATREDALRAIDMVCEYLERTEPTSPAPLLLRRARRMINRNFLQLMKELAPDSLAEVARVMGVDPDSVQLDDESA